MRTAGMRTWDTPSPGRLPRTSSISPDPNLGVLTDPGFRGRSRRLLMISMSTVDLAKGDGWDPVAVVDLKRGCA